MRNVLIDNHTVDVERCSFAMKKLRIKFDYSHGPIWKDKYDASSGEWLTGIAVIDNDKALIVLNEEAGREYSSLYSFDKNGDVSFDTKAFEAKKSSLLSLIRTIVSRINSLNNGSFELSYEESEIFPI